MVQETATAHEHFKPLHFIKLIHWPVNIRWCCEASRQEINRVGTPSPHRTPKTLPHHAQPDREYAATLLVTMASSHSFNIYGLAATAWPYAPRQESTPLFLARFRTRGDSFHAVSTRECRGIFPCVPKLGCSASRAAALLKSSSVRAAASGLSAAM
jgi:hypothetical protein